MCNVVQTKGKVNFGLELTQNQNCPSQQKIKIKVNMVNFNPSTTPFRQFPVAQPRLGVTATCIE